jgi:hypothetical protein
MCRRRELESPGVEEEEEPPGVPEEGGGVTRRRGGGAVPWTSTHTRATGASYLLHTRRGGGAVRLKLPTSCIREGGGAVTLKGETNLP